MAKDVYELKTVNLAELHVNTGQIEGVAKNPRFIKDERFAALKKSIQDDPEMTQLREVIAYNNGGELVIIMGNMRYRAMKELGISECRCKILPQDTPPEKLRAYIIKDNVPFGQNDWDILANEWDLDELLDFGLECNFLNEDVLNPLDGVEDLSDSTYEEPEKELLECPNCHHVDSKSRFKKPKHNGTIEKEQEEQVEDEDISERD